MFDECKFTKGVCPYSYKGKFCGYVTGENHIEKLKRCELKAKRNKAKKRH